MADADCAHTTCGNTVQNTADVAILADDQLNAAPHYRWRGKLCRVAQLSMQMPCMACALTEEDAQRIVGLLRMERQS